MTTTASVCDVSFCLYCCCSVVAANNSECPLAFTQMAGKGGHTEVLVVTVFILVAAMVPLSRGVELPLDKEGLALKELISHNKDLSSRMTLAMRDILHRRQAGGCTLGKIDFMVHFHSIVFSNGN